MVDIAENIIKTAFDGKFDKGGNPYINHLFRVSNNSINFFNSENKSPKNLDKLKIISLLHDLIEDCDDWNISHIQSIFQDEIISNAIELLTKKPNESYDEYIKKIKSNDFAKAVKLADLVDNMDITRLFHIISKDMQRLKKYHNSYLYLLGYKSDFEEI
jgi:5'-deoxynucleotidase YfbR-like HD superfamily hydrolase